MNRKFYPKLKPYGTNTRIIAEPRPIVWRFYTDLGVYLGCTTAPTQATAIHWADRRGLRWSSVTSSN